MIKKYRFLLLLLLLFKLLSANTLQVVFGYEGNTKVIILKDAVQVAEYPGPSLDGDVLQKFWINWASGRVAVGRGGILETNEMISYRDDQISRTRIISAVALKTVLPGAFGEWQIPSSVGGYLA